MGSIKEKALFAAEVLVVIGVCFLVQQHVFSVPVIGAYLPGYKPAAAS